MTGPRGGCPGVLGYALSLRFEHAVSVAADPVAAN